MHQAEIFTVFVRIDAPVDDTNAVHPDATELTCQGNPASQSGETLPVEEKPDASTRLARLTQADIIEECSRLRHVLRHTAEEPIEETPSGLDALILALYAADHFIRQAAKGSPEQASRCGRKAALLSHAIRQAPHRIRIRRLSPQELPYLRDTEGKPILREKSDFNPPLGAAPLVVVIVADSAVATFRVPLEDLDDSAAMIAQAAIAERPSPAP